MSQAKRSSTGDWQTSEASSLVSSDSLQKTISTYHTLEAQLKVRTLLALVHLPPEQVGKMKEQMKKLLAIAESDDDEWVKVASGLAAQCVFANTDASSSTFLEKKMDSILQAVQKTCSAPQQGSTAAHDQASIVMFLPLEYQYLSKRLQPVLPARPNPHFTVGEVADDAAPKVRITLNRQGSAASAASAQTPGISRQGSSNLGRTPSTGGRPHGAGSGLKGSAGAGLSRSVSRGGAGSGLSRAGGSMPKVKTSLKRQRTKMKMIDIDEAVEARNKRQHVNAPFEPHINVDDIPPS